MAAPFVDAALDYAARGSRVFPCRPREKRPATTRGLLDATMNAEQICDWWRRWPDANIAVATGPASGLLVLDIDGDDPRALLGGRTVPRSATQRTGGGGWQVFFTWPSGYEDVSSTRAGVLPNVDTRGRGGYVVVPPSIHPTGRRYRWCRGAGPDDLPLADPPAWLLELLMPRRTPIAHPRPLPAVARGTRYVQAAIERECAALVRMPKGARNERLNRAAFALARLVADGRADARPVVRALAYAATATGLPDREIARTITSAFDARGVEVAP